MKGLKGDVSYRCYYHITWKIMDKKTTSVPENCLLHVGTGSFVVLAYQSNPTKNQQKKVEKNTMITLDEPITINLTIEALKKITINRNSYRLGGTPSAFQNPALKSLTYQLQEAWHRLENTLAIGGANKEGVPFAPFADQNSDAPIQKNDENFSMFFPQNNAIIPSENKTSEVDILWDNKAVKTKNYKIMMWQKGETPKQVASASRNIDNYTLSVQKYGSYFVQVTTDDGKWKTSPHLFHIVPRSEEDAAVEKAHDLPIELETPKMYQQYQTDALQTAVAFRFKRIDISMGHKMMLKIWNEKKKVIKNIPISRAGVGVELRPGKYSWQVVENQSFRNTARSIKRSPIGTLIIEHNQAIFRLTENILLKNQDKKSMSFYLENGL